MDMTLFEEYLQKNTPKVESFHPHYQKALSQMLLCNAKRFRPALLLSVVDFYQPLLLKSSYKAALGLEYLHTYSLIHDDLPAMDDATLRRGNETLHKTYNEALAILVGDALNTEAFYQISTSKFSDSVKIKLIECLSDNGGTRGMVLGQAIDLEFENKKLSLEQIKYLHINKTAKLIACSLKMGAIISSLDDNMQKSLYDLGIKMGVLFQIQDDIQDVTMDSQEAGKDVNKDEDKNSFITLLGLENALKYADDEVDEILRILENFDAKFRDYFLEHFNKYLNRHKVKNNI